MLAFCLMPNHFHFVLRPREDGAMGRWMRWLMTSHVRRYHRYHNTSGHVWQGRYKSFPAQDNRHLYAVLRYVERNPVRANLAAAARQWEWSSLHWRCVEPWATLLAEWPVPRPPGWDEYVNQAQSQRELDALRQCVRRGRPYGAREWVDRAARRPGRKRGQSPFR